MEITLLQQPCQFTSDQITLLHHPLLICPRWRLPYFTREAPANLSQMDITLLYHLLVIDPRWQLLYYTRQAPCLCTPNGDYPTTPPSANLSQMEIPLLHQTGPI